MKSRRRPVVVNYQCRHGVLYVDTVTSTMANPLASDANQIWIGGSPDPGDGATRMTGLIEAVFMFNRALRQAEIQSLYASNSLPANAGIVLPAVTPVSEAAGATLDLGGASQTNDQLLGAGTLTCGGTLVGTNLSGTLAAGDSFKWFQAGSISGSFSSNSLPILSAGLVWNTFILSSGHISVVQTPPTNLFWSASGTNMNLSWPAGYAGWRLLMQTNNLANGISPNTNDRSTVANSQQTSQIVLPIKATWPAEFYRLIFP